jgi:hypothetical protein
MKTLCSTKLLLLLTGLYLAGVAYAGLDLTNLGKDNQKPSTHDRQALSENSMAIGFSDRV